mmetsp:Transcript_37097/g.68452  ORF Transcript_37097/g.68452 Transcript_37097/m.68452 type:complete len:443 (+) Transcript_37097:37-1365(+)
MALQRYDRFGAGENADVGGLPGLAAKKRRKRRALRWLGLLFLVTLLLLIFQVTLGWATNTLTLVADAAHGVADVVSYAFNFCVECLKKRGRSREDAEATTKMVDTWGSLISLVSLMFATIFACAEAIRRLREDAAENSYRIGPTLLVFSILSIVCNGGLMLMYWHWHKESGVKTSNANLSAGPTIEDNKVVFSPPPITMGDSSLEHRLNSEKYIQIPATPVHIDESLQKAAKVQRVSDATAPVPPQDIGTGAPVGRLPRNHRVNRNKGLNLCRDFAGEGISTVKDENKKKCCGVPGEEFVHAFEYPGRVEGVGGGVLSALHKAVHPGCTCAPGEEDALAGSPTTLTTPSKGRNLNVVAAMLHLITDVLRSILILGIALLIMLGGVHDAGHADAVCALTVAALIAAGSVALLLQLAGRLQFFCCPQATDKIGNSNEHFANQNL